MIDLYSCHNLLSLFAVPQIQLVLENHKENGNDEETDYPVSKVLQSKETIEEEAKEDIESNSLDNDDQHHKDSGDEGEVEITQEEEKVVEVPEIEQNDQFNLEEPENVPEGLFSNFISKEIQIIFYN